ncbi:glycine cleavage system aminomethyltransferase GcvT, partial [Acinetobacter baumannii]
MITNRGDHLLLVVNAARKEADEALLRAQLAGTCEVHRLERALLALQGPKAAAVLDALARGAAGMGFMEVRDLAILG